MLKYPSTTWRLVDEEAPQGSVQAIRGSLSLPLSRQDNGSTVVDEEWSVCPISFSVTSYGALARCDSSGCVRVAHLLVGVMRYSEEEALPLLRAVDGLPGHDAVLRKALLDVLLPH